MKRHVLWGPTLHLSVYLDLEALLRSHLCAGVTSGTLAQRPRSSHCRSYAFYVARLGGGGAVTGPPCECMGASTPGEVGAKG